MLVEEVRSTRCFVETDGGLGQVVRVVLSGQGAEGAEVTVEGDGVRCARAWQGRLGGGPQAVDVAVVVDDGHPVGTRLGLEAVLRHAGGETRSAGELGCPARRKSWLSRLAQELGCAIPSASRVNGEPP